MNKQEALEALLVKLREWEQDTAEVPARTPQWVANRLREAAGGFSELATINWNTPQSRAYLVTLGAAALYLLRDEVDVVTGRSLDEWLAGGEGFGGLVAAADPRPINGAIGRRLG